MNRPRELKQDAIEHTCRAISGHVGAVEAAARAIVRANNHVDEGLSGRAYDGVNRGGNDDSHPERRAGKCDPVGDAVCEFHALSKSLVRDVKRLRHLGDTLARVIDVGHEPMEGQSRSIGAGDCGNCGRFCPGTPTDRIKAGRCEACYVYRLRHEGIERPRDLWKPEQEVA